MSHISAGMAVRRTRNGRHRGLAQRIRALLERSTKPLSPHALAAMSGLKVRQVRQALATMIGQSGGVVSVRVAKATLYMFYRVPVTPPVSSSGRVAGRIEIGRGMRWGDFV